MEPQSTSSTSPVSAQTVAPSLPPTPPTPPSTSTSATIPVQHHVRPIFLILLVLTVMGSVAYWYVSHDQRPVEPLVVTSVTQEAKNSEDKCVDLIISSSSTPACAKSITSFDITIDYKENKNDNARISFYQFRPHAPVAVIQYLAGMRDWFEVVRGDEFGSASERVTNSRIYNFGDGYMYFTRFSFGNKEEIFYTSTSTSGTSESKFIITPELREGQRPIVYSVDPEHPKEIAFYELTSAGFKESFRFKLPDSLGEATVGVPCDGSPCPLALGVPFKYTSNKIIGIYYFNSEGGKVLPVTLPL